MATSTIDWGTVAEHTLLSTQLDSLADGSYSSAGTAVDLGDPAPFFLTVEAKIAGTSASAVGPVHIVALWSADNTDFSNHSANELNGDVVTHVDLNGTATAVKVFDLQVRARYLKLVAVNSSGAALAANAGDIVATEASVSIV